METYTNRKEQTYYLKVGTTKTGKSRYYAATDPDKGKNAETMPAGYAFRENVNGQVSVGKKKPQQIEDAEMKRVEAQIRSLQCDCRAEIKGKTIVLHTTGQNDFSSLEAFFGAERLKDYHDQHALYQPMLRFSLVDKKERLFQTERMCFIGEPDWLWIGSPNALKPLTEEYIPLLDDEESLFEEVN